MLFVQRLSHKFWAWMHSVTQRHLMDLYGTYSCRVVQNESKEYGISSLYWIAYSIWFILLKFSSRPLSVNCLYLWMEVGGMQVNNTHTSMIFLEIEMFSASFNIKRTSYDEWCGFYTLVKKQCIWDGVLFELQNCDRGRWFTPYTMSHISYVIHHREFILTHFEPLYMSMYLIGATDGCVALHTQARNLWGNLCTKQKLVMRHKWPARDKTKLLFSDWLKSTFIFDVKHL